MKYGTFQDLRLKTVPTDSVLPDTMSIGKETGKKQERNRTSYVVSDYVRTGGSSGLMGDHEPQMGYRR